MLAFLLFCNMNKPVTIQIPALLGNEIVKTLTFDTDGLHIERPSTFAPPVFLPFAAIEGYRYGVKWIKGYAFPIGRTYFVELKMVDGKLTTIKLNGSMTIRVGNSNLVIAMPNHLSADVG
jgi:hypothetical protein